MYCTYCGSRLAEDAHFCTKCGVPIHARVQHAAPVEALQTTDAQPEEANHGLKTSFLEFRRTTLRGVPTFVLVIIAFLAAAGTAYAAYRAYETFIAPHFAATKDQTAEKSEEPKKADSSPAEDTNARAHEAYEQVLQNYRDAIETYKQYAKDPDGAEDPLVNDTATNSDTDEEGFTDDNIQGYRSNSKYPYVNILLVTLNVNYSDTAPRYLYIDLDDDGIDELLIGPETPTGATIYAEYTFADSEITPILLGWERCNYTLRENGVLLHYGSGGAWDTFLKAKKLENGKLVEFESYESTSTPHDDGSEPSVTLTHRTNGVIDQEIPNAKGYSSYFDAFMDKYPVKTDANWQSL